MAMATRSRDSRRSRAGWIVGALLALLIVGSLWLRRPTSRRGVWLSAIPAEAFLVVDIDVVALGRTAVGRALLGRGRKAVGAEDVGAVCGADPLEGVTRMAIVVPGEGSHAGFGLFATGALHRGGLLACAERFIVARGGQPQRRTVGSFDVVRDAKGAVSAAEIAIDDQGLLIIAEGAYLNQSIATARGQLPSLRDARSLHDLRDQMGEGEVRVSAVFSPAQHIRLLRMLEKRGEAPVVLSELAAMAGRVRFGDSIELDARVACRSSVACKRLFDRIVSSLLRASQTATVRALGVSQLLKRVRVEHVDDEVRLALRATFADVEHVLARLRALEALSASMPGTAPPPAPRASGAPAGSSGPPPRP